jgi:hypothetical protein
MKILLLSHTRSGSTTLYNWIAKELNLELHEVLFYQKKFNTIFELDNIILKVVVGEYYPPMEFIEKFDKVICLSRDNSMDSAISFLRSNKTNMWHESYEIDVEWVKNNTKEILYYVNQYDIIKSRLKEYKLLQTTYESIYINKTDIPKIVNYLNITNPKYLDDLDYSKKYRRDKNTLLPGEIKKLI